MCYSLIPLPVAHCSMGLGGACRVAMATMEFILRRRSNVGLLADNSICIFKLSSTECIGKCYFESKRLCSRYENLLKSAWNYVWLDISLDTKWMLL